LVALFALYASLIQNSAPYATQSALQGQFMNLHEYQSKELFAQYAIPILGGSLWVVKALVYANGRGKAGGVRVELK
jgi:hypothetical protein